ncbi:MAG: DNA repair protein RecN [Armatimonadota bacterium]|nr:DNA repair protein RecN [Armatimonadota bacterium]
MLSEIHIRDFALIDRLDLSFRGGFSAVTGETGAGKSIIIDAISAILGERLPADVVRTGAERAVIEAVFDVADAPRVKEKAGEMDIEIEDNALFLSREIGAGKSQCRINGRLSPLSTMRDLTEGLLDLHGQHEHQSLLAADAHLEALDNWLGSEAAALRARMAELYARLREVRGEIEELRKNERERAHLLDLYKFQLAEIESAALTPGEEEQLAADRARLANAEKLHAMASGVYEALSGGGQANGAVDVLGQAARQMEQMAAVDPSVADTAEMLQSALFSAQEVQAFARTYSEGLEFNPRRLETIEERLDLIRALKRKYGDSTEQILAYAEETAGKIRDMENSEERGQELQAQIDRAQADAQDVADRLSRLRRGRAKEFESAVMGELSELAMERTEFRISIEDAQLSAAGIDAVEFLISPNPGEPLKPLVKIASGGEMSRIMLALKSVMAVADRVPTLIFDEIDTGIGGRTANVIGDKLAALGATAQVMCVTHLPQIASRASSHLNVAKQVIDERTVVRVSALGEEDRVEELARMLGSTESSAEAAIQHAKEMLRLGVG